MKKNTLRSKGKDVIKELRACFNEMKSEEGKGRVYEIFEEKIKEIKVSGLKCLNYKTKAQEMVLFFNIPTDAENEIWLKLILFFALHQLLKDQRNIVNHSLTRGGRIQVKHLPELVNRYIDMYSELICRVK